MTTLKAAKAELAANGISLTKQDGEYRVAFKGTRRDDTYSEAYFTSDLHDALMTGLSMARKAGTLVTRVERIDEVEKAMSVHATVSGVTSTIPLPDETPVKTLGQLNAMLKPEAQGWTVRRSPSGYYYMTHDTFAPSAGIYVYRCAGTTLGFWRRELAGVIAHECDRLRKKAL